MYFYLKVFDKKNNEITSKLITADDKKDADIKAKGFINDLFGNDELEIKREGVKHDLLFVSPQQHEENIRRAQESQDKNPEIKAAALILSGGEYMVENRLNYQQANDATRLIIESEAFPEEYSRAYGLLMMHLSIECEVDDDGEDDYYEDIPEEEMIERKLSRLESVYFGCDEHYKFPPALEGDVWQ